MEEETQTSGTPATESAPVAETVAAAVEPIAPAAEPTAVKEAAPAASEKTSTPQGKREPRPDRGPRPPRENQPPRQGQPQGQGQANRPPRENRPPQAGPASSGGRPERGDRPPHQGGDRPERGGGDRDRGRFEQRRPDFGFNVDIELEKLVADSLYLDNQAHIVAGRMRDMDSATKSHLRRFYNAVRRACRTPEAERQHEFVMLRARLAYTIARHSLRSLDSLEKLLLQVTRKNDAKGYERFKDLFEAIIAYNE